MMAVKFLGRSCNLTSCDNDKLQLEVLYYDQSNSRNAVKRIIEKISDRNNSDVRDTDIGRLFREEMFKVVAGFHGFLNVRFIVLVFL